MTSIYDMMGRYTLPSVRDDSPFEHVEKFFQVKPQIYVDYFFALLYFTDLTPFRVRDKDWAYFLNF